MKPYHLSLLRSLIHGTPRRICKSCATNQFHTLPPLRQTPTHPKSPVPRSGFKPNELQPLGRPIGQRIPPHPNDNDVVERRSWGQRKKDLTDWDKHLQRREELKKAVAKPYFKDWKALDNARGKFWIANERLWKRELSLWFPNLRGRTLNKAQDTEEGGMSSTTTVLSGKVSVVGVFSRLWAREQCFSFFGKGEKQNPEVRRVIEEAGGRAQVVEIDVEDKPVMRWFGYLFGWNLRRGMRREERGNYFYLKELPENVRETIGVVNVSAGTVFLVDKECRIRWAGSGDATEEEKVNLVKGLKKLLAEK
jgi:ATPase complex subunit ATP10